MDIFNSQILTVHMICLMSIRWYNMICQTPDRENGVGIRSGCPLNGLHQSSVWEVQALSNTHTKAHMSSGVGPTPPLQSSPTLFSGDLSQITEGLTQTPFTQSCQDITLGVKGCLGSQHGVVRDEYGQPLDSFPWHHQGSKLFFHSPIISSPFVGFV